MKILQINSVCGIRSTGRICTDIAEILEENNHECKILYGRENVPEKFRKYAVRIGTDCQVNWNGLKARVLDNEGFNAIKQTKQILSYIENYKPDLVHLHNLHGYYINMKLLFNYLSEQAIPVVCTMHDCWSITGHCAYFTKVKCEKWKAGCYDCELTKRYPISLIMDHSKINWNKKKELFGLIKNLTVITPSIWLADIMKQSFLGNNDIQVINNGIDTVAFKRTQGDIRGKYRLGEKKIVLGVASAWGDSKGLPDFIELSKSIENQYQIVLVGVDEKQMELLPENIIGIKKTNDVNELAQLYSAAMVFVNPTHSDNYPTTNLEARACGTPVITYNTGGSPESAGTDAVVLEPGDIEGIRSAIDKIANGNAQNIDITQNYKLSRTYMAEQYISLYFEKLSGDIRL